MCWWEAEVNLVWEKHYSGAIVLEKKSIFSPLLLTAVAVHCWRATSAYTWSDVDDVLLTTPSFFMFTWRTPTSHPGLRLTWKMKTKQVERYLLPLPLTLCSTRQFRKRKKKKPDCFCFLTGSRKPILMCQRDGTLPQALCQVVLLFLLPTPGGILLVFVFSVSLSL